MIDSISVTCLRYNEKGQSRLNVSNACTDQSSLGKSVVIVYFRPRISVMIHVPCGGKYHSVRLFYMIAFKTFSPYFSLLKMMNA